MFKQVFLPLLAVIILIVVVGLFIKNPSFLGMSGISTPKPTAPPAKSITVGDQKVIIQIADTSEKRSKGLSGTSSLKENEGMLFIFDSKGIKPLFWMKDMLIPLDIIWIGDGKIVKIDKNVPNPKPGTTDSSLKTYSGGVPVDYVLEVNAGFSDKNNIKAGDGVDLSGI